MSEYIKELRMVNLQQAFQKLTRLVCSIIEENHLEVMFSTLGENIEVDKEIADRIALPIGDLIWLLLDKAYSRKENNNNKRIGSIEVVAYEESNTVHIDITSDVATDIEELKSDNKYIENMQKLNNLKCRLETDDMHGEGVRMSVIIQR